MPADLVIRGGTVVDGTGAPGRAADVAIADGVIREIGPTCDGERELDASGCVVAPGFIDIHTHYDAQVFWDPALRPSSYHGVTTVVAGNCGFTIAPTRPEHHDVIVRTLENVEDMDPATLTAGVAWDFETFPEYLDAVGRRGTTLNFTAYVGHSPLRLYVMGDAAYERAATADEIERMAALVREGIDAGGAGFSTSFSFAHRGIDGKPVPSRFAEADEVEALFRATADTGKGVVLITPGEQCTYADVYEWQPQLGRPFTYPLFAAPGRQAPRAGRAARAGAGARRRRVAAGHAAAAHHAVHDGRRRTASTSGQVFGELHGGRPRGARSPRTAIPEWRARAAADLEQAPMTPRWETFEVSESERFPELEGRRVSDLAAERGCSPLDVMCELALAEDLHDALPRLHRQRRRRRRSGKLLTHDHVALGLSDAGAHVDQLCDAPLPTDLLGSGCASAASCRSRRAVRKLTGEPADMFGFDRRGYLREGEWADVSRVRPGDGRARAAPARARLPGRRRAPHRRGADRPAARARERHARSASTRSRST